MVGHNRPDDRPKEGMDVSRCKAFGRIAQYTAPVMLALLLSTDKGMAIACPSGMRCSPSP